jgi:hypothetical protein
MADPLRPSKLILIGTLSLTMGFVVSYSYPGSASKNYWAFISCCRHSTIPSFPGEGHESRLVD